MQLIQPGRALLWWAGTLPWAQLSKTNSNKNKSDKLLSFSFFQDSSSGAGSGPVVSTLAEKSEVVPENQKDLFDWCKEGRLDKIKECLKSGEDINQRDDEALLHT